MKRLVVAVAFLGAAMAPATAAETLYQRAQIVNAVGGSVVVSAGYQIPLDMPAPDCIDGEYRCLREQRYGQVYRIDFVLNELGRRDERPELLTTDAGTVWLATDLDRAQELELEGRIEEAAALLHGDSFRHPWGGWTLGRPPLLQQWMLGPSNATAWACLVAGRNAELLGGEATEQELRITPLLDGDVVAGVTTAHLPAETSGTVCDALRGSIDPGGGRGITTPYDIESMLRTEIEVSAVWYPARAADEAYQPLPAEMEYEKTAVDHDEGTSSMSYDAATEAYTISRTAQRVKQKMRLGVFEVEPPRPESAAWVTRWTVSTHEQTFGAAAGDELVERQELTVVALPLVDPLAGPAAELPRDPGEDLLGDVVGDFDRASRLDVEVIASAFHASVSPKLEGDWMLVYCSLARPPEYGIGGFLARTEMANGHDVCDTVSRLYP